MGFALSLLLYNIFLNCILFLYLISNVVFYYNIFYLYVIHSNILALLQQLTVR